MRRLLLGMLVISIISMVSSFSEGADVVQNVDRAKAKLIEWGWDAPSPAFVNQNIRAMEQFPFEGIGINVPITSPGDENVGKSMFYPRAWIRPVMLTKQLKLLQETDFQKFTDNFLVLRTSASPEIVDWFDEFSSVINNFKVVARFTREAGLKGIILDAESYGYCRQFKYSERKYEEKSWDDYRVKTFERGMEIITAICSEYPDITILFPVTYTYTFEADKRSQEELSALHYGLLPAFLDGIVAGSAPETQFVDIYEHAYRHKTEAEFNSSVTHFTNAIQKRSIIPETVLPRMSLGFGLWLRPGDTPEQWEKRLSLAFKYAQKYVWVYAEHMNYWGTPGVPESIEIPGDLIEAQRNAKP